MPSSLRILSFHRSTRRRGRKRGARITQSMRDTLTRIRSSSCAGARLCGRRARSIEASLVGIRRSLVGIFQELDVNFETILYRVDGPVATVTLNRPDELNTIVPPMPDE